MRRVFLILLGLGAIACQPELTPTEKAAKDRSECSVIAIDQSGFDPVTAEEPPRTISSTHQRGGEVIGSGAVTKGAAGGAVAGVAAGRSWARPQGRRRGRRVGGLFGGVRRHRETQEMVTSTRPNPARRVRRRQERLKSALDACLAARAAGAEE